jgi:phage terminase large subunit
MSDAPQLTVTLPDGSPYVLYTPHPAQINFHQSNVTNLIAIGNRGGGKSLMLRMDAHMRALSVPGCNLILVRKTYPELLKSHLIYTKQEMKLLGGYYHSTDHIAHYPNGSKLFFSHVANESDALNLLSAEFLAAYYDELSTIPWEFFVKLSASVRVGGRLKDMGLIAATRAATNPLGPSAGDIYHYFVNKDVDPEEDPEYDPSDWGHIRVDRQDNPSIDQEQYIKRFAGMPEYLRRAWLEGEFALENQLFDKFRPKKDGKPYHVISQLPLIGDSPIVYMV